MTHEANEYDNDAIGAVCKLNDDFFNAGGRKRHAQVITFGCKMNENDSEKIMGLLVRMGFAIEQPQQSGKFGNPAPLGALGELNQDIPLDNERMPDIVLLNTCCVRDNAEQRFYGILGSLKRYKTDDPSRVLAVCGCMAQEDKTIANVLDKYPHVDFIFGTKSISKLPSLLLDTYKRRGSGYAKKAKPSSRREIPIMNDIDGAGLEDQLPMRRKAPPLALVSIMNGCDNFCSYCIVQYVRGREQSRAPESIIREVEGLAACGYREITLLGQNVNSYGADLNVDFVALLNKLAAIEGIWRIRFMTSHPKDLSDRLICAIRDLDAVCPQLHLPVQSGSTAVLKRMNRGYSREEYIELINKLRNAVPDITLTTDVIVGFPGETDSDFEDTLSLVEEAKFDLAYTFIFSPREGTAAAGYSGRVPDETIKIRFDRLLALQNNISRAKNIAMLGACCEVLCEGASKTNDARYTGRTPGGKVVNFDSGENLSGGSTDSESDLTGKLVIVRIDKAGTWSLDGTIIKNATRRE